MSATTELAGWLTKRGNGFKTWRRRWFVMGSDAITYHEGEINRRVKGTIPLSQITQLLEGSECGKISWPITDMNRCWGIKTQDRLYVVFADSVEEVMRWKLSLAKIILSSESASEDVKVKTVAMVRTLAGKGVFFQEKISESRIIDLLSFFSLAGRADLREMCVLALDAIAPGEKQPPPAIKSVVEVEGEEESGIAASSAVHAEPEAVVETTPEPVPVPSPAPEPTKEVVSPALGHGRTHEMDAVTSEDRALNDIDDSWRLIETQLKPPAVQLREEGRKQWRTVRIFVSSTFADMFSEREVLVRQVFPKLRAWCDLRRIEIIECDLRWGVPKESTSEVVFRTCLSEIDRSREENGNVFFINLLGDRYGWVPTPAEVPSSVATEYNWVPNVSITHMEILHGAYKDQNPNAAFFLRDPSFLADLPPEFEPQFVDKQPLHKNALVKLREKLKERFPKSVFPYTCKVKEVDRSTGVAKVHLENMELFSEHVYNFLTQAIERQYPLGEGEETECERMATPHNRILEKATRNVFGREKELAAFLDWCTSDQRRPYFIVDENGQGKSTFMALSAAKAKELGFRVFFHSCNADYDSAQMTTVMERLYMEFSGAKDTSVFTERSMQQAQLKVEEILRDFPAGEDGRPALVFVDSLEALHSKWTHISSVISSLFCVNLPHVKFVYSCDKCDVTAFVDDNFDERYKDCLLKEATLEAEASGTEPPTEIAVSDAGERTHALNTLEQDERAQFVASALATFNKRLDARQMEDLLNNSGSISPLWLAIACEELRVYGVFETVSRRIKDFDPEVVGLLRQVLQRVESEDDSGGLLHKAVCLLAVSSEAITELEMLELLGQAEIVEGKRVYQPIPMSVWSPIYTRIKPLLSASAFLSLRSITTRRMVNELFVEKKEDSDFETDRRAYFREYARCLADRFQPTVEDTVKAVSVSRKCNQYIEMLLFLQEKKELHSFMSHAAWRFSSYEHRRQATRALRCHQQIPSFPVVQAGPEKMCSACAMKVTPMNTQRKGTCAMCQGRLVTFILDSRSATNLKPTHGESIAYSCRNHNASLYNMFKGEVLHQKCFFCNFILMPNASLPLMLCSMCSQGAVTCCRFNLS